ncbi:MAG: HU family DNA-binding protein [Porticoccaceae bacterium]
MAAKKGTAKSKPKAKAKAPAKRKTPSKITAARSTAPKKASVVRGTSKKIAAKKKPLAKKPLTKKPVKKKVAAKKSVAKKPVTAVRERYSKTQIISELAANTHMTRKQVNSVLDELAVLIERHVKKRSVGEFVLAGLVKIHTVKRPAKKSYKGINPFTGKETIFKERPASVAVKVHALKGLKDMAQ